MLPPSFSLPQTAPHQGAILARPEQPSQSASAAALGMLESPQHMPRMRPTGVSILAFLMIIGGVMDIVTAASFLVLAEFSLPLPGVLVVFQFWVFPVGGILLLLLSIGLLVSGIIFFVLAYGLWKGRGWAWTWTFISSIASLIASAAGVIVGIGVVGVVLYPILIFYLTRARVKSYFDK